MTKIHNAETAVAAMVNSARTEIAALAAIVGSRDAFSASTVETFKAISSGVSASAIARGAAAALKADRSLKGHVYVSPNSVGYHARTGRLLSLNGELPENVGPRDAQSAIVAMLATGLKVKDVDAILGAETETARAYASILKATRKAIADVKAQTSESESAESESVPTVATVQDLLTLAGNAILKACENVSEWSESDAETGRLLAVALESALADIESANSAAVKAQALKVAA